MQKTILTILGSALLAASMAQVAMAAEHKGRKAPRAPTQATDTFRNSNAYAWPPADTRSRYEGGALSAPAGR